MSEPGYVVFCSCGNECREEQCVAQGWAIVTKRGPHSTVIWFCPQCWARKGHLALRNPDVQIVHNPTPGG